MGLEELTDFEIKDFRLFEKTLYNHSQQDIYTLLCDDMIKRHNYKDVDELIDKYIIYRENKTRTQ
jgi:hypothetical protein